MPKKKRETLSAKQHQAIAELTGGQTQEKAAQLVGVNKNTLSKWMNDELFMREVRLVSERARMQFESRLNVAANDGLAVMQKAMRSDDGNRALKAAVAAVNAEVKVGERYKKLQVEGFIAPAPMIVIAPGEPHPIFNPQPLPQADVIDTTAEELDGDSGDPDS
jgi:transposase-like protein